MAPVAKAEDAGPGRALRGRGLMLAVSFTLATARDLAYLVAIAGFIFALKGLSSPKHARRGELVGAAAATLAIAMTFTLPSLRHSGWNLTLAIIAMVLGAAIAVPVARFVKMTAMPQLVAIFNGVGGGAAALISIVELLHLHSLGPVSPPSTSPPRCCSACSSGRCPSRGARSRSSSCRS